MQGLRDENCCEVEAKTYIKAEMAKGHIHSERVDWKKKIYPETQRDVREFCNLCLDILDESKQKFPLNISGLLPVQILN